MINKIVDIAQLKLSGFKEGAFIKNPLYEKELERVTKVFNNYILKYNLIAERNDPNEILRYIIDSRLYTYVWGHKNSEKLFKELWGKNPFAFGVYIFELFIKEYPEIYKEIELEYKKKNSDETDNDRSIKSNLRWFLLNQWEDVFKIKGIDGIKIEIDPKIEKLLYVFYRDDDYITIQGKVISGLDFETILDFFPDYYQKKYGVYLNCLDNMRKYLKTEQFNTNDIIYVNVGDRDFYDEIPSSYSNRYVDSFKVLNNGNEYEFLKKADCKKIKTKYVDVFIITEKYFKKYSINDSKLIERSEHILQKDIKKIEITEDCILEIYFHGLFDPERIVLDDFEEALKLQKRITNLREKYFNKLK